MVKKVAGVLSGPTKLKAPSALLWPATWNLTVVPAGVEAFQEIVVHVGVLPPIGLASFAVETKVPSAT